jgi:hypothetical protein
LLTSPPGHHHLTIGRADSGGFTKFVRSSSLERCCFDDELWAEEWHARKTVHVATKTRPSDWAERIGESITSHRSVISPRRHKQKRLAVVMVCCEGFVANPQTGTREQVTAF